MINCLPNLLEVLQSKHKATDLSWLESVNGPDHEPEWTCTCLSMLFETIRSNLFFLKIGLTINVILFWSFTRSQ